MKEVWVFADWNRLDAKEKRTILASQCTDVVLGIAKIKNNQWSRTMSDEAILSDLQWLKDHNIRGHLMVWIARRLYYLEEMRQDILALLEHCRDHELSPTSLLYDAEKDWHNGKVAIETAINFLLFNVHAHVNIPIGVTGLAKLHSMVAELLKICDYGLPQAYSCWFPDKLTPGGNGKHWSHSMSTEPRVIQRDAHRTWSRLDKSLIMGLGNYYLTRPARFGKPKMSASENLSECIDETINLGYTKVAYWSLNSAHKKLIIDFFAGLRGDLPFNLCHNHQISPEAAQWMLVHLGYDLGKSGPALNGVDGNWGPKSQSALNKFRSQFGSDASGPLCLKDVLDMITDFQKSKLSNR